jgi:hypothetical protein
MVPQAPGKILFAFSNERWDDSRDGNRRPSCGHQISGQTLVVMREESAAEACKGRIFWIERAVYRVWGGPQSQGHTFQS